MSLFLSDNEKQWVLAARHEAPVADFYWALLTRADRRASSPGLSDRQTTSDWWHHATEYLTEAAMAYALRPDEVMAAWLRETTLAVARRPLKDWVGPGFRDYNPEHPLGHLETAHLSIAVAVVLDLAGEVFTENERDELQGALVAKGIQLCRNWMDDKKHLNNWRCILLAGVAVPAAVLNRAGDLEFCAAEFKRCIDCFQPDGSYGESLQYGNYAMTGLVYTREALVRRQPDLETELPLEPYVLKPRWDAASYLYSKPLSGWGAYPLPRSVNFNDSAAIYRASGDNLLHIAARARKSHPEMAGLARWLFETHYLPCVEQGPTDQGSFGFVNTVGFLTLPLLVQSAEAIPPQAAGMGALETFSCGDVIARDQLNGKTILAAKTGGDLLHAVAHLHGDVNSFILVHNQERLLVDPGHACYRNLIHGIETSTLTHNTCTFTTRPSSERKLEEDQRRSVRLEQKDHIRRMLADGFTNGPACDRGTRLLIARREGEVTIIGSEASKMYGEPIQEFSRFWIACGPHVLFVVDRVIASEPVTTSWSWLLNNRDDQLDLKIKKPDRLVARRGNAGMKLFHVGEGSIDGPLYGFVHDAYHTLPNQQSEGKSGSGLLVRTEAAAPRSASIHVHAICVDTPGLIAGWHLKETGGFAAVIEAPTGDSQWKLKINASMNAIGVTETAKNRTTGIIEEMPNQWKMDLSR